MIRRIVLFSLSLLCSLSCLAQPAPSHWPWAGLSGTLISGTALTTADGDPIVNGNACFTPVDANDKTIGFRNGSLQVMARPACWIVTNGVVQPGFVLVPTVTNVFYHPRILDRRTGAVLRDFCLTSVTGSAWSFDTFDCATTSAPPPSAGSITPGSTGQLAIYVGSSPTSTLAGIWYAGLFNTGSQITTALTSNGAPTAPCDAAHVLVKDYDLSNLGTEYTCLLKLDSSYAWQQTTGGSTFTLPDVVTAGSCGDAAHSPTVTYDSKGRVTNCANNAIAGGTSTVDMSVINLTQAPYYASPWGATTTTGTFAASATSGTVGSCSTFTANEGVYIEGGASGGWSGTAYIGKVVSCSGTTMVIAPAITNAVTGAMVQHDETAAFVAAIAAFGGFGGTVQLPNASATVQGVYLVNGALQSTSTANAILQMPTVSGLLAAENIKLEGFSKWVSAPIIQTSLPTAGAALFGGYGPVSPHLTGVGLWFKDVRIVGPTSGSATMIDGTNLQALNFEGAVQVQGAVSGIATTGNGVLFPSIANNVILTVPGALAVQGFGTAVRLGEHASALDILVANSTNGVVPDVAPVWGSFGDNTPNAISVQHVWCGPPSTSNGPTTVANCIAAGSHATTIHFGTVDYEGTGGTLISDPSNYLHGSVGYALNNAAGCPTSPTLSGAANLVLTDLNCGSGGKSTTTVGSVTPNHLAVFNAIDGSVKDGGALVTSPSFSSLSGGVNTSAAMQVGPGASITPTGAGTVQANNIAGTVAAGTGVTMTGAGTPASPYTFTVTSAGGGNFASVFSIVNVSASRAVNAIYHNTSGNPIIAVVTVATVGGNASLIRALCDASSTPTTQVAGVSGTASTFSINAVLEFVVPAGYYYQIPTSAGLSSIQAWVEYAVVKGAFSDSGDLAGSRAFGTTYHNTTGGPVWLQVDFAGTGGSTVGTLKSDSATTPTQVVWSDEIHGSGTEISLLVPVMAGNYYALSSTGGTPTVQHWHEFSWGTVAGVQSSALGSGRTISTSTQTYYNMTLNLGYTGWSISGGSGGSTGTLLAYYTVGGQGEGQTISLGGSALPSFNIVGDSGNASEMRSVGFGYNPAGVYGVKLDGGSMGSVYWTEWWFN